MMGDIRARWRIRQRKFLRQQALASDHAGDGAADRQVHPDQPELDGAGVRVLADSDGRTGSQRQRHDRGLDSLQPRPWAVAATDLPVEVDRRCTRRLQPSRPPARRDSRSSGNHAAAAASGRPDGGGRDNGRAGNPDGDPAQRQSWRRSGPGAGRGRAVGVRQIDAGTGARRALAGRHGQGPPRWRRRVRLEQAGTRAPCRLPAAGQRAFRRHAGREHRALRRRRPCQGRGGSPRRRPGGNRRRAAGRLRHADRRGRQRAVGRRSGSAWRWRARSTTSPRSSSSTSPTPASTRPASVRCWRHCWRKRRAGRRWSSSPTAPASCLSSTACWCCAMARCSCSARATKCSPHLPKKPSRKPAAVPALAAS